MNRSIIFALMILGVLVGCSSGGDEYIGKWTDIKHEKSFPMEIERNGDNFVVLRVEPNLFRRPPETVKYPAKYKDGLLEVHHTFKTISFSIDKKTGHLLAFSSEYKKKAD